MTSSVSHSTSADKETVYRTALVNGHVSYLDFIFPVFDNAFQNSKLTSLLYYPMILFLFCQFSFLSFWMHNPYWNGENSEKISQLHRIFFFTKMNSSFNELLTVFLYISVVFFVCFTFFSTQMIFFSINRRFLKWLLNPIVIASEIIYPILILPTCSIVGFSLNSVFKGEDNRMWIFIVFGSIELIIEAFLFYSVFEFSSSSVCITASPLQAYNSSVLSSMFLSNTGILLASYVMLYFDDWSQLLCIVMHIYSYGKNIKKAMFLPFYSSFTNSLLLSVLISSIVLDISMFAAFFVKILSPSYIITVLCVIIIVCFIAFQIYCSYIKKSVLNSLKGTPDIQLSENEKNDFFSSIGLDKDENNAIMYMYIGFTEISDYFIDWSLLKYILMTYSTETSLCKCCQVLNYFPSETRLLNRITSTITSRRNLTLSQRFLIYQVYHVKTLRQFSASSDSNSKLSEMRSISRSCESIARSIWDMSDIPNTFYETYANECSKARSLWAEALRDYPNNPKFCDEYCRFLLECDCNFPEAIKMRQRSEMIEVGKSYSIDYSFRSMVRCFPQYLKRNILDVKGNMITKVASRRGSSNAQTGHTFSSTSDSQLDDELEETLGKQTMRSPKTRLALHRALVHYLPSSVNLFPIVLFYSVISVLCIFGFVFIYGLNGLKDQQNSMNRLDYIAKTRFYLTLGDITLLFGFVKQIGLMIDTSPIEGYLAVDNNPETFYNFSTEFLPQINKWVQQTEKSFEGLIADLAELSISGPEVYNLASAVIEQVVPISFCSGTNVISQSNTSLSSHVALTLFHQRKFSSLPTLLTMLSNTDYCEILNNWESILKVCEGLFTSFSNYQIQNSNSISSRYNSLIYIVPPLLFIISFLPFFILLLCVKSSLHTTTELISSFDPKIRLEAKELISLCTDEDESKIFRSKKSRSTLNCFVFYLALIAIVFVVLGAFMCSTIVDTNQNILNLNIWDEYASVRLALSAECLHESLLSIVLSVVPSSMSSSAQQKGYARESLKKLINANDYLLKGTSGSEPCIGYDTELDKINIEDECEINVSGTGIHDMYRCTSANKAISVFHDFVIQALGATGSPDKSVLLHMIHLSDAHIWPKLLRVTIRLMELSSVEYSRMTSSLILYSIVEGVSILFFIFIVLELYKWCSLSYKACLSLIKRVQPIALINNKIFSTRVLHNKEYLREEKLTVAGNIIHNSSDAILCTGLSGVVEIVNPSVTTMLGYTPEQLLGQPITTFFVSEDADKIISQISLMKNGQSSTYFESHMTCITDAVQHIPTHITILGMKPSDVSEVNSFVIILRDETVLKNQQKQAEEAKIQSEKLLFQILPRDIVVKLNRGEKDISFSVPSATIIFIDIVRFSEYSATLSPQEIMGNLSMVFAAFDSLVSKYNLITKIKLIGDVYMAAAGLFSPNIHPEQHAEQVVKFGIDALAELDEINVKLNANLNVRIGVNTGGPIIAGVLGKDKPMFDIIGDPINVASRLQTTCDPGRIQIPQSTYDLIQGMNFSIEQRGEVFLKGKGQTMTYFVNPSASLLAQLSSAEFSIDSHGNMN